MKYSMRPNLKEKHGVWDPMPKLTVTSLFMSTPESTPTYFTMGNPIPESILTLCQSQFYPPLRDFGDGFCRGT